MILAGITAAAVPGQRAAADPARQQRGREPGPAVRSGIQARDVWFVMAGPGGCHRDW